MRRGTPGRVLTGLAAGALLSGALLGAVVLGALVGAPNVAYDVFEWLVRVLPGRLVVFGLESTLHLLEALGMNIKDASKATEAALALTEFFVAAAVLVLVFFLTASGPRLVRRGVLAGLACGVVALVVVWLESAPASVPAAVAGALWVAGLFTVWGWAGARLCLWLQPDVAAVEAPAAAPHRPASVTPSAGPVTGLEAVRLDRRHFLIRAGGLLATFVVLGAELDAVLRAAEGPRTAPPARAPIPFPNAGSHVRPVPGTRPEYTPVADHYRVDIDLTPPQLDAASWRLRLGGLVAQPQSLSLGQLRGAYRAREQFVTLQCISNPVGGPLIGTTLWSGPSLRDVLASAGPLPAARYAHVLSADGYDESVDLSAADADPRIILAYGWNGQPLPQEHGYPLRVYVPDVYGMKQPKWITEIVLVPDLVPGYWVTRGWDQRAEVRTTSVIDTVATGDVQRRAGRTYVPLGGIADAGARGISKVEVQVDGGPWEAAELRQPLSPLTWVIWRYEWSLQEGDHVFAVRAYDGSGVQQTAVAAQPFPKGAAGIDTKSATVLPA